MLRTARVLIVPGHRSETFCLAAAEAIAMGVPVTTLGIGSLRERVVHHRTGLIARNWPDLATATIRLLQDDALWTAQHVHCLATRANAGWDHAAQAWEDFARDHLNTAA
jgi:glycosyltransferase involved in cell wall biosynthesis